jgi:2-methylcitrate dehydratase PrpD
VSKPSAGERHTDTIHASAASVSGTITANLAGFISDLTFERIPGEIIQSAKNLVLDTFACIIAASQTEIGAITDSQVEFFGAGAEATIVGSGRRSTALGAGYANARLGNALDFDETYPGGPVGGTHIGVAAVCAALALCERKGLSGSHFLQSIVAGYELGGRIADVGTQLVIEDGEISRMPPIWGMSLPPVFAAVGAAGHALSLSPDLMAEAFGLAGASNPTSIGPMWAQMMNLPNNKYCDIGWCAVAGMFAALSSQIGSTGPQPILDGAKSIFQMSGVNPRFDWILDELGQRWALADITYKPWPSCRWHHHALTALVQLRDLENLRIEDIEEVVIEVNTGLLSPRFLNQNPSNLIARQFSFPHAVAMILARVPAGADWFIEECINRPSIVSLRQKVSVKPHSDIRARQCAQFFVRDQIRQLPAAVSVKTRGKIYRTESDFALGDPWDSTKKWDFDQIADKFRSTTISRNWADRTIEAVQRLEKVDHLEELSALLRIGQK